MSEFDPTPEQQTEVLGLPSPNQGEEDNQPAASIARTTVARWYAIQVASSCEKKVKATLEQRAVTLGVSNRILEIEIPQTPAVKLKKDGSRQTTEEKVRIIVTSGPFKDFQGEVIEVSGERNKLNALLSIFGRETPVELEFSQINKQN